ncbi:hypothetical protein B0I31_11980 [Saccharothrix carnea]|uniref:Uncharacterized protein n=1 Tax=Saccharothrix carnea TaxID=1280637 RepID=A0A2P8HZK2_SACCR|nr:hypothetical protein [Saccharothrix carnea]PSL51650.1 hypothetical protein B0I31_11980 [Saccharothrix carnea]
MNLTDLTDVLRDHAGPPPDAAHGPRMSGIRAKVRASRRRGVIAAAVSLVAVLGVTFALTAPAQRESEPAVPTTFPAYHAGTRIVAQAADRAPAHEVSVQVVPTRRDLRVFTRCEAGGRELRVRVTVNGMYSHETTCGHQPADGVVSWTAESFPVGSPVTFGMSVGESDVTQPTAGPIPAGTAFALAIGEEVPVEDYRFPPRPESLSPVDPLLSAPAPRIDLRRADRDQPNGTWRTTVDLPDRPVRIQVASNTPGRIQVLANGVRVYDHVKWTYEATTGLSLPQDLWEKDSGAKAEVGAAVEITVIAERTSGDWAVVLR